MNEKNEMAEAEVEGLSWGEPGCQWREGGFPTKERKKHAYVSVDDEVATRVSVLDGEAEGNGEQDGQHAEEGAADDEDVAVGAQTALLAMATPNKP